MKHAPTSKALDAAAAEGIEPNASRWLRFLAHVEGEPIELQALDVPRGKYAPVSRFAHATTAADFACLALEADRWEPHAPAVFTIANAIDPAVATRAEPGRWHDARKGTSTTDGDIRARRALYVDIDARRPTGTSATAEQLAATHATAERVLDRLARAFPVDALALGHSGNGRAVLVALEATEPSAEQTAIVKLILGALAALYGTAETTIDASVCDPKRLLPAWGTTKRKGSPGLADRPHRRTGLVLLAGDRDVRRVPWRDVAALARELVAEVPATARDAFDRAHARDLDAAGLRAPRPAPLASTAPLSASRPASASSAAGDPFALAKACDVRDVAAWLGLADGDGVRCPGCGSGGARDTSVAFVGNGLKCSHARCAGLALRGFRTTIDLVCEVRGVRPLEAVRELAARYGFAAEPKARAVNDASRDVELDVDAAEAAAIAWEGAEHEPSDDTPEARAIDRRPGDIIRATIGRPEHHLPTGIETLDRATRGGPRAGTIFAIGGAPNVGKTSLAVQLATAWALRGHPVVVLAVDEDVEGLCYRVGQSYGLTLDDLEGDAPGARARLADLLDEELPRLRVVDGGEATLEDAADLLARLAADAPPDRPPVLCLDSAQTARTRAVGPDASPRERVDAVVSLLRALRARGWLVVVTSELSRAAYRSRDARDRIDPIAAFKESGAIEYAAQLAIVLVSVKDEPLLVDAVIAKNKRGTAEPFRLERSPRRTTYREVPRPPDEDASPGAADAASFDEDLEAARDALRRNPGIAGNDAWCGRIDGIRKSRKREAIRALTAADEVINRGTTKRPRLYLRGPAEMRDPPDPPDPPGDSGDLAHRNPPDPPRPYRGAGSGAGSSGRVRGKNEPPSSRRVPGGFDEPEAAE